MESFDRLMIDFLQRNDIPGASLAVMKDGRLVYARGFGLANRDAGRAVEPATLFRIASISKPLTSAALLTFVDDEKIRLTDKLLVRLPRNLRPAASESIDPRLRSVTLAQVLRHAGGWDREVSFDPMFRGADGGPPPETAAAIVRSMLTRPLDFEPGARYAYSNFGYCALGRVIENVAGTTYAAYVRDRVLAPLGIGDMRLGRSLREQKAPREATYYGDGDPGPYGGFRLEVMDSHGGWIASAPDLLRFARMLDYPLRDGVLKADTLRDMLARPPGSLGTAPDGSPAPAYYAFGWQVRPIRDGKVNAWHIGSLDGTSTLLVHRWDNLAWAVLFNKRRSGGEGSEEYAAMIDEPLHEAAAAVTQWPKDDLFPKYPSN